MLAATATFLLTWPSSNGPAQAQAKKFTGSGKVLVVLAETKMLPGHDAKHEVTMVRRIDVTKDDVAGEVQVSVIAISDYIAGSGQHKGYRTATTANGDKIFSAYEGVTKTTPKAGGPPEVAFSGKWWYVGGTGQWKGVTGGGTYRGGLTPEGPTYQYEGEYTLKP
jgi:hypothetical protein